MRSFLTLYKRLNFLIQVFHIPPDKWFARDVKSKFNSSFTPQSWIIDPGVKTFTWEKIRK